MDRDMNKLLQQMVKYDLGSGLLISLVIGLISSFFNAKFYLLGICVALINFICSGYITSKYLGKPGKGAIILLTTFLRIIFILLMALPFIGDVISIAYYMAGFITHHIILIVYCIKNRKGSV